ncbi:MAG: aminopeptidase P N-terminal domain-containing protein, partial [Bacteroidota bacterium]
MFSANTYQNRRQGLIQQLDKGIILFLGNEYSSKNYKDNHFPFRQDSSFLYYIGINQAHLAATIDLDTGETCLYGDDASVEMIVWTGPQPSMQQLGQRSGIKTTKAAQTLGEALQTARSAGRTIHILPPYRPENSILLTKILDCTLVEVSNFVSTALIKAIVKQRSIKTEEEVADMTKAVNISRKMHVAAMQQAQAGQIEAELAGLVEGIASAGGGQLSYPVILTINGQTLHNHYHGNKLQEGQLVLGDFGAETVMGYAGDITRTFPVSKRFTSKQKEIYEIVLQAETQVINKLKPGVSYLEMHKLSARIITEGLKALGLMKGNTDASIEAGAHALFFPHGLGHM